MTTAPALDRCASHGALAGWACTACHAPLCPDCAGVKFVPPITMTACGLCGGFAEPLLRKKSEAEGLARRVRSAFAFPLHGEGLPMWLGFSGFAAGLSLFGAGGLLVAWAAVVGSLFGLARSTARGREHFELGDGAGLLMPLLRFAVVMTPAWLGAFLSVRSGEPWGWWLALVITALWSPTAFVGAVAGADLLDLLNPFRVLSATAQLGKDFAVYLGALLAVGALILGSAPLGLALSRLPLPLVSSFAAQLAWLYAPIVGARIAGQVLLLHGPVFGWGDALESYEPVLKDVQPRGALPEKVGLPSHLPSVIELEPEAPREVASAAHRFEAIELHPDGPPPGPAALDVSLLPSHGEQSAADIRKAIALGDHDAALDGWRATGLAAAASLTVEELLWLGQTASSRIDLESAELAFTRASQGKGAPELVGRARVMLGRLLAERLSRADDGARWMRRVLEEQPGTKAASFAAQWLSGRGG